MPHRRAHLIISVKKALETSLKPTHLRAVNKKTIEVLAKLFAVVLFVYLCFSAYKVLDMMGAV